MVIFIINKQAHSDSQGSMRFISAAILLNTCHFSCRCSICIKLVLLNSAMEHFFIDSQVNYVWNEVYYDITFCLLVTFSLLSVQSTFVLRIPQLTIMKIRSMQTCIMSSLPRCIFRCSVYRYVTLDNFFKLCY